MTVNIAVLMTPPHDFSLFCLHIALADDPGRAGKYLQPQAPAFDIAGQPIAGAGVGAPNATIGQRSTTLTILEGTHAGRSSRSYP